MKKCSFCFQKKEGFMCQGFRGAVICEACVKLASDAIVEQKKRLAPVIMGDMETLEEKLERSLTVTQKRR